MLELTNEKINEEFCKEVGIKKACCYLLNKDTKEKRYYSNLSGLYKKPKNWKNILGRKFKSCYPDLINNPSNFCALLNIQWFLFGQLGNVYERTGDECFEVNYLKTRLNALKLSRSLGGGDMLEEYKNLVKQITFEYNIEEE